MQKDCWLCQRTEVGNFQRILNTVSKMALSVEELRKEIDKGISDIEYTIGKYNTEIIDLESKLKHLNNLKIEYAKQNLEKN